DCGRGEAPNAEAPAGARAERALPPAPPPAEPTAANKAGAARELGDSAPGAGAVGGLGSAEENAAKDSRGRVGGSVVRAFERLFDGNKLIVERNGARRIRCEVACGLEAQCGFRDDDDCRAASCDDDVRKPSRMDYCLALDASVTCLDAATCSCNEACWKRGECAGSHADDDECERSCRTLVKQEGAARYRENRCILERSCSALSTCSGQ
ncbi:MAG TPA: hypothetical protein VGF99_09430, partial [Myxococcota bacterium]